MLCSCNRCNWGYGRGRNTVEPKPETKPEAVHVGFAVNVFLTRAATDLKSGRKLYFSYEVCKEIQNALESNDYVSDVVIGFESSRSHHSPYLTLRK